MATGGKVALITGITGQDGSYLAEFLLDKGYVVHGIRRRASCNNGNDNIQHLLTPANNDRLKLHYGDLMDFNSLVRLVMEVKPSEVYNLAAQSHVQVSFELPAYTAECSGMGALNALEAIRVAGLEAHTRFYQASTSELYGKAAEVPQRETTPFHPRSPYACAKLYAFWITKNYREAYNMFTCNGILFNHESPRRGEHFVTRKITLAAARIAAGLQDCLHLGNLDAQRDWGHARDFVAAMWAMLQQEQPDDYVVATGVATTVRRFCELAFGYAGIPLTFSGAGVDEVGAISEGPRAGEVVLRVSPEYFRPAEVDIVVGDSSKAQKALGWDPVRTGVEDLAREMVVADMKRAMREAEVQRGAADASRTR